MIIMGMPLAVREFPAGRKSLNRLDGSSERGLTMIEVLVTLVIVSIGLLGAAAMVINGLESNRNAYLRTQASIVGYDMADRIRSNPEQVASYAGFEFDSETDDVPDLPACFSSDNGCGPADLATADLAQWASSLKGSAGGVVLLPAAQGSIALAGDEVTVTVSWVQSEWDEDEGSVSDQSRNFIFTFNL